MVESSVARKLTEKETKDYKGPVFFSYPTMKFLNQKARPLLATSRLTAVQTSGDMYQY